MSNIFQKYPMNSPMKPINCSCGAVLFKATDDSLPKDNVIVVRCGKCGLLHKVSVSVVSQVKIEPIRQDQKLSTV